MGIGSSETFRTGTFVVDPFRYEVRAGGKSALPEPGVMSLLVYLLSRPGEVVSKEELLREVWEGRYVSDDVVAAAVYPIRKAFSDRAAAPRYLETVHRRGPRPAPCARSQTASGCRLTQFGAKTERGATRLAYWDNEKNEAVGQIAIDYGRPVWKDGYDEQPDGMTRGKIRRMGENFWSSLDTSLSVTIGGVEVPAGYYYLAVERSADGGDWRLLVIDPEVTRQRHIEAYEVGTRPSAVPITLRVPLTFERRDGAEPARSSISS